MGDIAPADSLHEPVVPPTHDGNPRFCPGCQRQTLYWRPVVTHCQGDLELAAFLEQSPESVAHTNIGYLTKCCPKESRAEATCKHSNHTRGKG